MSEPKAWITDEHPLVNPPGIIIKGAEPPHVPMALVPFPQGATEKQKQRCRGIARKVAAVPDLYDTLAAAVARVEIANAEGNPILSGWLVDARALLARIDGRE